MSLFEYFDDSLPMLSAFVIGALVLLMIQWIWVAVWKQRSTETNFRRHWIRLLLTAIALVSLVFIFSLKQETRQSVTVLAGILGIVVSAAISISSTTFISNSMAGLMLRALGNFKVGDFVHVGDQFGRVSERGIFHVEIQTEDSDLATIPNLYFVSQPIIVVRASKTIVSAKVSLGYDVSHNRVEPILLEAARSASLQDPFVYLVELGDFSITYRIAAVLNEVEHLLGSRSLLRKCVLDGLHEAGIEIVSPNYVNQRQILESNVAIPDPDLLRTGTGHIGKGDSVMFDKALAAEKENTLKKIAALEEELAESSDEQQAQLTTEIQEHRDRLAVIEKSLAAPDQEQTSKES